MSYVVYVLLSKKDTKLYVGCTTDIQKRLDRHNRGSVPATKLRRPLVLIYTEAIDDKTKAFNRERFLKSLWAARFKSKLKRTYLENTVVAKSSRRAT